jgi:ketosteroid isomerase-like protein
VSGNGDARYIVTQDIEALARHALQLMDEGELDEWEWTMTPDCELIVPGATFHGHKEIRWFVEGFRRAFPDVRHTIDSLHVVGDTVVLEATFAGTHTGPLRTPDDEIGPTGKPIRVRQAQLVTLRNGKAVSIRTYFDRLELTEQLERAPRTSSAVERTAD